MEEFDYQVIQQLAEMLCDPSNLMLFLRSKSFEGMELKEEKWFKTKYSIEPIPEDLLKLMTNPACDTSTKKIDLPPINLLIPKNFDVLPKNEELSKQTQLLK